MESKAVKLTPKIQKLLAGALRRYTRFHKGHKMTDCWTGLGFVTEYKPAINAGLMESATNSQRGCMRWFRLTPAGAKIVKAWVNSGWNYEKVEAGEIPPVIQKAEGR